MRHTIHMQVGKAEFLGRTTARPHVYLAEEVGTERKRDREKLRLFLQPLWFCTHFPTFFNPECHRSPFLMYIMKECFMRECFVRGRLMKNALRGWMFHEWIFSEGMFYARIFHEIVFFKFNTGGLTVFPHWSK